MADACSLRTPKRHMPSCSPCSSLMSTVTKLVSNGMPRYHSALPLCHDGVRSNTRPVASTHHAWPTGDHPLVLDNGSDVREAAKPSTYVMRGSVEAAS